MKLIIACTPSGGIGYNNKLPWTNLQGDLSRFKKLTLGQAVVMGYNTWESLPKKPLSNRQNYVVSSKMLDLPEGAQQLTVEQAKSVDGWLIGGAMLVNALIDNVDEIHMSLTKTEYECDTFLDMNRIHGVFKVVAQEINADHTYLIWKRQ